MLITKLVVIGTGGFIGSALRFMVSVFFSHFFIAKFPYATLMVNLSGCFLIGFASSFLLDRAEHSNMGLFFITGLLGSFTTFSAFSYETFLFLKNEQAFNALIYSFVSLFGCLLLTILGYKFSNHFFHA